MRAPQDCVNALTEGSLIFTASDSEGPRRVTHPNDWIELRNRRRRFWAAEIFLCKSLTAMASWVLQSLEWNGCIVAAGYLNDSVARSDKPISLLWRRKFAWSRLGQRVVNVRR